MFLVVQYCAGRLLHVSGYSSVESAGGIARVVERLSNLELSVDAEENDQCVAESGYVPFTLGPQPLLSFALRLPNGAYQLNVG